MAANDPCLEGVSCIHVPWRLPAASLPCSDSASPRAAATRPDTKTPAGTSTPKSVTIYSSYPLQGAGRAQSEAAVNGAKLALEQAGGKAGDIAVKYEPLDDATAQAANWTPEQTSANARKAAQDKSTAVYLGEFNSGASAVSIPILNEAGIAQISPSNTAVGLTTNEPGATPGEPDKYYPTGKRTYARIVPKDTIQGAALATLMKEDGCTKVQLLNDKEVYGAGLANNIEASAKAQGLTITSNEAIDKNAANYRSLAQKAKAAGDDCMVFAGITANNAAQIFKDFAAALPDAKLYGPDGVADTTFASTEGRPPGRGRQPHEGHDRHALAGPVPAGGPGVLQGLHAEVRRGEPGPVRDLRLRGDGARARRDQALQDRRQGRRGQGAVRDQGPQLGARHLLDRRQRRHVADRLRRLLDQGRQPGVRQDDQGAGRE